LDRHFILYKPPGYLSQFVNNQRRRKNKKLLGELFGFPEGTMAIGRLDEKSEGLLLLSTNGMVSAEVRSKSVEKEYFVQVDGIITDPAIKQLQDGVEISLNKSTYTTLPCDVKRIEYDGRFDHDDAQIRDPRHGPKSWISITLTEGKYRQVRKMTAAVGYPTLRLIRVRIGEIKLGRLAPGKVKEVKALT